MSTANVVIPVPISGFGASVDVSALVGEKTVILSGRYQGAYVLYGSHDTSHFAPLLIFNAGGIESIRQTFSGALQSVMLKSLASNAIGVSASISGLSVPLDNSFVLVGPVGKGYSQVIDLGVSSFQTDLNFMGFGRLNGAVVVEGSSDGASFNPIGEFSAEPAGSSLLNGGGIIEFSPLGTRAKVRYVRLNVLGDVPDLFTVTIGGSQSDSSGGGETLREAYMAGVSSIDQTMTLTDANGGGVVIDASNGGFTGNSVFNIIGNVGENNGFEVFRDGTVVMGGLGVGIVIGEPGFAATAPNAGCVAIGYQAQIPSEYDPRAIAIGMQAYASGLTSIAIGGQDWGYGYAARADGDRNIAIGGASQASNGDSSIAIGSNTKATGIHAVAVGPGCKADSDSCLVFGNGSEATWQGDIVIGTNSMTRGLFGSRLVIGNNSWADAGDNSIVLGDTAHAYGTRTIVMGCLAVSNYDDSIALGPLTNAGADQSICIGSLSAAQGASSLVIGWGSTGSAEMTTTIGSNAFASASGAIAIGSGAAGSPPVSTEAFGICSVAIGSGAASFLNGAQAIGDYSIAIGPNAVVLGEGCIGVGVGVDMPVGDHSISIGESSSVTGNSGVVMGVNANSSGDTATVVGGSASSIGDRNIVVGASASALVANDSIVIGTLASSPTDGGIAIGESASVATSAGGGIAIGSEAAVQGEQSIVIGSLTASGIGVGNIAMGLRSSVNGIGANNTCIGSYAVVGDDSGGETRDFYNNVRLGGGNQMFASLSVGIGNNVLVGSTLDPVIIEGCVAIGEWATVTGSYGMAFGSFATAGAGEIVFSGVDAGGANKFEVVSSVSGNPDLFNLDVASLSGINTTVMTLLIEKADTTVVAVPVTLSIPDPVTHLSNLQVYNV